MKALRPVLLAAAVLLISNCGYTMSSSLDGAQSRTLRLDTIENRLFPPRPGYEYELTRRLKDEIATDTRLKLTDGRADVVLQVSLTRFNEPILNEDPDSGDPTENQVQAAALVVARGDGVPGGEIRRTVRVSQPYALVSPDSREAGITRLWRDLARGILDVAADTEWAAPAKSGE